MPTKYIRDMKNAPCSPKSGRTDGQPACQPTAKKPWHASRGFLVLAAPVLIAATFSVAAASIYMATAAPKTVAVKKALVKKAPVVKMTPVVPQTPTDKMLSDLKVSVPTIGVSDSPVPNPKLTEFNIGSAPLPAKGIMQNFGVDKDVAYKGGQVKIDMPEVDVSKFMPTVTTGGPPAGTPTGAPTTVTPPVTTTAPPAGTPTTGSAPAGSQPSNDVSAANCAQFSSMPNASYCSMAGQGADLCNRCKAAGM